MSHSRITHAESMLRLKVSGALLNRPSRPNSNSPRRTQQRNSPRRKGKSKPSLTCSACNVKPIDPSERAYPLNATLKYGMPLEPKDRVQQLEPDNNNNKNQTTPHSATATPTATATATTTIPSAPAAVSVLRLRGDSQIIVNGRPPTSLETFTVEAIICLSAGDIKLRKHKGLTVDVTGKFLSWKCCASEDSDPFSWCSKWTGAGLEQVPGIICQHTSFVFTTTYFTVLHEDGSSTTLDDFFLPVDRFVHVAASFDGAYARLYINGGLMSAKCTESTVNKRNETKKTQLKRRMEKDAGHDRASSDHVESDGSENGNSNIGCSRKSAGATAYLVVGKQFIGMMSYVRLWNKALTSSQLTSSLHPWLTSSQTTVPMPDVAEILVPQHNTTSTNNIVISLPICLGLNFINIPVTNAEGCRATLTGQNCFVIHPPLFFGAKRNASPSPRQNFGWPKLGKLSEQLRRNGAITLTICTRELESANQILKSFTCQTFAQDWVVRQKDGVGQFNLSLTYFDIDGQEQERAVHFLKDNEDSFLHSVEAIIRSATTQTDRMLHQRLRNVYRSNLWWCTEYDSGQAKTFTQIFRSLEKISAGTTLKELMQSQHGMLPKKKKTPSRD